MNIRISIIGAGRVAWHLAPALENVGYSVAGVWSRTPDAAQKLCGRLYNASFQDSLDFQDSEASLFILAVSDDALSSVASELILPDGAAVVHTSGSQPLEVLEHAAADHTGVFYPLQTFSKERIPDFSQIPFCLEANSKELLSLLKKITQALGAPAYQLSSTERSQLHVGAVFASNFTNHLLFIARQWLAKNELPEELLNSLVAETVNKSLELGPFAAQTGPARRGDEATMASQLEKLQEHPAWSELYYLLSEDIRKTYES